MKLKRKLLVIEKKITDHNNDKYITTTEFNKLTSENFATRLKQTKLARKSDIANLVKKIGFDNKLSDFNKIFNSNKTTYVLVENELNELSNKIMDKTTSPLNNVKKNT